jgi:hypothetical protein
MSQLYKGWNIPGTSMADIWENFGKSQKEVGSWDEEELRLIGFKGFLRRKLGRSLSLESGDEDYGISNRADRLINGRIR